MRFCCIQCQSLALCTFTSKYSLEEITFSYLQNAFPKHITVTNWWQILTVTYFFPLKWDNNVENNTLWAIFTGSLPFPREYGNILWCYNQQQRGPANTECYWNFKGDTLNTKLWSQLGTFFWMIIHLNHPSSILGVNHTVGWNRFYLSVYVFSLL